MSGSVFRMFSRSSTTLRVALIDDPCGSVSAVAAVSTPLVVFAPPVFLIDPALHSEVVECPVQA
jgi:hypothetical protein